MLREQKHKELLALALKRAQPSIVDFLDLTTSVEEPFVSGRVVASASVPKLISSFVLENDNPCAEILWALNVIEKHYSYKSCENM